MGWEKLVDKQSPYHLLGLGASRALVAAQNGKIIRVPLPSAARRRSLRFGSVLAVSPPTLHFSARRTADRSMMVNQQIYHKL
jgi:hypothetical protein